MAILQEEGNKALVQAEAVHANGNPIITNLKDRGPEDQLLVYPNPSSGKMTICLYSYQKADYSITDVHGRIVKEGSLEPGDALDITSLAKGIYNVRVFTGKIFLSKKIIRE
jgi:hypothetical protein